MVTNMPVTFVIAVNNREILEANFLASPCLRVPHNHQIIVQENFSSASKAYNDAIDRSANDLMVFAHQDVVFPEPWLECLNRALGLLKVTDPRWGVLGCYGASQNIDYPGHIYFHGILGRPFDYPKPVQTLDEIVLILRKSSGLRFDERLPHFHLYGADICLTAAQRGMENYAISAFCIHNSQHNLVLPKEFYEGCKYFRQKWQECLPVQTTCIRITRFSLPLYWRKLNELYLRYVARKTVGGIRIKNPLELLGQVSLTQP